ncbi:MAG: carboxypeptidase-like regulatory domain-containing protein, partial [Bacteroidota bacterium]
MKLKLTRLCLGILLLGILQPALAQTSTLTGKISNKTTGDALAAATVVVEGSRTSTITDASGNFTIAAPAGSVLLI